MGGAPAWLDLERQKGEKNSRFFGLMRKGRRAAASVPEAQRAEMRAEMDRQVAETGGRGGELGQRRHPVSGQGGSRMGFRVRVWFLLLLFLLLSGLALFQSPVPALAQSPDVLLETAACRNNPHSEDCICASVRKFAYFPQEFTSVKLDSSGNPVLDSSGNKVPTVDPWGRPAPAAKDMDRDGKRPQLVNGLWVDEDGEADNAAGVTDEKERVRKTSDLEFMRDDRYKQRCALSYFREDQRRLWYFAVALGASFTVISLIWVGVVHMQNTASGVDISRTRGMLVRVLIGLIILACAFLIWDGLNELLFKGLDFLDAGSRVSSMTNGDTFNMPWWDDRQAQLGLMIHGGHSFSLALPCSCQGYMVRPVGVRRLSTSPVWQVGVIHLPLAQMLFNCPLRGFVEPSVHGRGFRSGWRSSRSWQRRSWLPAAALRWLTWAAELFIPTLFPGRKTLIFTWATVSPTPSFMLVWLGTIFPYTALVLVRALCRCSAEWFTGRRLVPVVVRLSRLPTAKGSPCRFPLSLNRVLISSRRPVR